MTVGRIPSVEGGIQPTLLTAKGDLISATAASTVARLPVGSDTQILVADSTASTGLAYKGVGVANGLTTTGDTIYSSSGTTQSRLGIGSTGQVLTVASGVPSWATPSSGGMTLLSTTALSGTSTTVSSIDQTYTNLVLYISTLTFSANAELNFTVGGINIYEIRQQNNTFSYDAGNVAYFDANFGATGNTWFSNYSSSAISSIAVTSQAGTATMSAGSLLIYGVK